ncbi:hypothetical protein KFK09_005023 [Dendrobium nobile]|uniref:Uncharacterized protein n=1 Tax=Dendrobium nobile TaxID=94219 RepID=A0A8T3BY00_DENNO|nr:hypothetical protein KFK09_005023 [Dendrobium nobile]
MSSGAMTFGGGSTDVRASSGGPRRQGSQVVVLRSNDVKRRSGGGEGLKWWFGEDESLKWWFGGATTSGGGPTEPQVVSGEGEGLKWWSSGVMTSGECPTEGIVLARSRCFRPISGGALFASSAFSRCPLGRLGLRPSHSLAFLRGFQPLERTKPRCLGTPLGRLPSRPGGVFRYAEVSLRLFCPPVGLLFSLVGFVRDVIFLQAF